MNKRRYTVAAIIALAGFAALFAVLPSQGSGTEVVMKGFRYRPATIRIPVGGAVSFKNEDDVTHTANCEGKGCPRPSGDIQPGLMRTMTFTAAGTYRLFCIYHDQQGMEAFLTVGRAT